MSCYLQEMLNDSMIDFLKNKKILFIAFDLSGYYSGVYQEIKKYAQVDYYNTAEISYHYEHVIKKIGSFFYKILTGKNLKNLYRYKNLIAEVGNQSYDITLIVRPDLFFDSQLSVLKKSTKYFIAYYHDSINNIKRKSQIIHYFDKVYSYEKIDVKNYDLSFLPNFIYFADSNDSNQDNTGAFSVMSKDYRLPTLKKVAEFLRSKKVGYQFYVMDRSKVKDDFVILMPKRMTNQEVIENIKKSKIIVDIHKYGIQEGLTFRVFEAIGFKRKLITTNKDIKSYDFYNPNNIHVIEDVNKIVIPDSFFESDYQDIPQEIYNKYTVQSWLKTIFSC